MDKSYDKLKKLSQEGGVVEYQAEIPTEIINKNMEAALDEAAEDFEISGFRKGKAPKSIVRQNISEFKLLDSAADAALYDAIKEIIDDEKLEILGSPEIYITKIAVGNPLEFKIKLALNPQITLPDYKKIGKEVSLKTGKTEVSEKEIDEAIEQIRQVFAAQDGNGKESKQLPEVNDDFVKRVSQLSTVAELRAEVKKRIFQENELYAKEKNRDEIISEIIRNTKIEIPELLVDQDLHNLSHEREDELRKVGITMKEYLEQMKKTAEDLEKEDRRIIENRLKSTLVLQAVRKKENISAEPKEVDEEISVLRQYYPEHNEKALYRSAEAIIVQRKLFAVLENKTAAENK